MNKRGVVRGSMNSRNNRILASLGGRLVLVGLLVHWFTFSFQFRSFSFSLCTPFQKFWFIWESGSGSRVYRGFT